MHDNFHKWVKPWVLKYPPDTVFLLGLCVVSGLGQLFTTDELLTNMPLTVVIGWSFFLMLGSLTSLVGIFWAKPPVGLLIEGAGRSMLWPSAIAYAIVLFQYDNDWFGGTLVGVFGLICYIRAVYVKFVHAEWLALMEKNANGLD